MSTSSTSSQTPIWIYIELIPLPDKHAQMVDRVIWWNPDSGEILGDSAEEIIEIIEAQRIKGSVTNAQGTFEIVDPYKKSTELASILGQYYWVLPMPVSAPYESPVTEIQTGTQSSENSIQ